MVEFQVTDGGTRVRSDFASPLHHELTQGQPLTEIFEWNDLRAAIDAARETFTIVELGAGYGRFSVAAVLKAQAKGLRALAIAVEAEPSHFKMMHQHFLDNGLDPADHHLIEAAATGTNGVVWFVQGHAQDWYGQAILPSPDYGFGNWPNARVGKVPGLSLASIIGDAPVIDLIDMDVQGEEANILRVSTCLLDERVKRVHIATHNRAVEDELWGIFNDLRWKCCHNFGHSTEAVTEYGTIRFLDGIQSWVNPGF